jgi:hypothetical protein
MSYVEKLIQENTKAELSELAEDYGIEVGRKSKAQLAEEIVKFELGVPQDTKIDAQVTPPAVKEVNKDDFILVRFTGSNAGFQVGEHLFSRNNPFSAVPPSVADHVYRTWPTKFRPASHVEVEQFYS